MKRISRVFTSMIKIGATGFEPATSRPPAERATKLRHTPIFNNQFIIADNFHFEKRFTAGFLFVIIIFRINERIWSNEGYYQL